MKKIMLILGCCFLWHSSVMAAQGKLSVITGKPSAKIYIDGEFIAKDFVRKYSLEEGEHYVRVEYNGTLMYAKMVTIYDDHVQTITSENFVDIRTNTANRGAIERESKRLQETKGTVGIGLTWADQYPAKGMSLKWFSPFGVGVQFSAIGNTTINHKKTSEIGLRAVIPMGHKIFSHNNLTGYSTLGAIQKTVDSKKTTYVGGSVGIEFAFGDPLYFSVEVGVTNPISSDSNDGLQMSWATGLHFYF